MKKLAIVLDSFCGKEKKEVENLKDHYFVPLKLFVDGKMYNDGVDLDQKKLLEICNSSEDVKTSQPSPEDFLSLFSKLTNEYENIIYFPTPKCLSSTADGAQVIAREFKNIHIVSGIGVGLAYFELAKYILDEMAHKNTLQEILDFAKEYLNDLPTFIIPKNVKAFVRGGRMGKSISIIFDKMKIIPIVCLDDEIKLKKKAVKRSGIKAAEYAANKILSMIEKNTTQDYRVLICHTLDQEHALQVKKIFEEANVKVEYELTSSTVNAHTGDGAYSVGAYRKLSKEV